jgi:xanthine dehydrogenase YagT iron-sulfur-binding subunit
MHAVLTINGREHRVDLDSRMTLLDTPCKALDLTGTKKKCGLGQRVGSTRLIDGDAACFLKLRTTP